MSYTYSSYSASATAPTGQGSSGSMRAFPEVKGWYYRYGRWFPAFGWGLYHGRRAYKAGNPATCGIVLFIIGGVLSVIGLIMTILAFTALSNVLTPTKKGSIVSYVNMLQIFFPIILGVGVILVLVGIPVYRCLKVKVQNAEREFREHPESYDHFQPLPN